jgi:hypothetical protein
MQKLKMRTKHPIKQPNKGSLAMANPVAGSRPDSTVGHSIPTAESSRDPPSLAKLSPVTFFISGQTQPENTEKLKPNLKNRF